MPTVSTTTFKRDLFGQFARLGKALASPNRLEILDFLAQGEHSVDRLAEKCDLSIANASQHLQQLRRAGLVVTRKQGQYVYYRLAGDEVVGLISALRKVAERHLAEVDRFVRAYLTVRDSLEPVPAKDLLKRARQGLVTVLDVRPAEEFAAGHLPGAINVPLSELGMRLKELKARREIVAYCRGPYCMLSYEAVAMLREKGFRARRLADGFPEWKTAGLPIERS